MLRIPHHHMDDEIVASRDEESRADLRHVDDIVHELVDRAALVLRHLDHEQGFEPDAERLGVNLDMYAAQDAAVAHPLDALVGRGWGKADLGRDLLDGKPSIILQEMQNADVCSVEIGFWHHVP